MSIKIVTVCNAGVATSLIAKGNVEKVVAELGYKNQVRVDACDIGSANALDCDIIVTSKDLAKMINTTFMQKIEIVTVANIVSTNGMKEALAPVLETMIEGEK